MTRVQRCLYWGVLLLVAAPMRLPVVQGIHLQGAWKAERYELQDGSVHPLAGRIFFTDDEWLVVFFVLDGQGRPQRGSAEGGRYTLDGDRLLFIHHYQVSGGAEMEGLPASPWRLELHDDADAPREPTHVSLREGVLILSFPSGNRMSFHRSTGG